MTVGCKRSAPKYGKLQTLSPFLGGGGGGGGLASETILWFTGKLQETIRENNDYC